MTENTHVQYTCRLTFANFHGKLQILQSFLPSIETFPKNSSYIFLFLIVLP